MKKIGIIGTTATNAAGKTGIVKELYNLYGKKYNYHEPYSVRSDIEILFEKEYHRKPIHQSETTEFCNEYCRIHGAAALILPSIRKIVAKGEGGIYFVESFRRPAEIEFLLNYEDDSIQTTCVGIDAPAEMRFQRKLKVGDYKTVQSFEEFLHMDEIESNGTKPWQMNIKRCLEMLPAEAVFQNLDGCFWETIGQIQDYLLKFQN